MITKVVGVSFSNEDGSSRASIIACMTESDKVCLERDPYNQYDANAVKVCVLKNGEKKQIGFLSKDVAADVSSKLRRNVNFKVTIQGVGFWNDKPFCEIEIIELASATPVSESTTSSTRIATGPFFTPNKPVARLLKPENILVDSHKSLTSKYKEMDCKIMKDPKKDNYLNYNIQAIEICKKNGVQYSYSTSNDLKKDYLVVDNVPEVIEELQALPCWIKEPTIQADGKVKFETDWLNI